MNKKSFFVVLSVLLLILTACSAPPPKEPKEMIRESNQKLLDAKSITAKVNLSGEVFGMKEKPDNVGKLDLLGAMAVDTKDPKNLLFDMNLDITVHAEDDILKGVLDLRFVEKNLYVRLKDFTPPAAAKIPEDTLLAFNLFKGKWLQIPLPPEEELKKVLPDFSVFRDLMLDTSLYGDVQYKGMERANGVKSFSYFVKSTPESQKAGLEKFLSARADVPESDKQQMLALSEKFLKLIDIQSWIWIGAEDQTPVKQLQTVFITSAEDPKKQIGRIDFTIHYSDFNKALAIEKPADAIPFDPKTLFAAPAPSSPVNP